MTQIPANLSRIDAHWVLERQLSKKKPAQGGLYSLSLGRSVLPESIKPVGSQFRVSGRMLNVPMTQVGLNGPRIDSTISQVIAAGMSQLMRMDVDQSGLVTGSGNYLADR